MKNLIFILALFWSACAGAQSISGGYVNIASGTKVVNSGGVTIGNGAAIDNSGTITFGGDWINNSGTTGLVNNGGSVVLNGSVLQNIAGSDATVFNDLTINNAAGVELSAAVNASVAATLFLTTGIFISDANYVIILPGGNVSRTNGWVNGNLRKAISSNGVTTYEVGDANYYAPADLNFTGVSGSGNLTAATIGSDHPQILNSNVDAAYNANRYWTITNDVSSPVTFNAYDATFHFNVNDLDAGADPNTFTVSTSSDGGTTWITPTTGTVTSTSTQGTGIASFGDFIVGPMNCVVPVANAGSDFTKTCTVNSSGAQIGEPNDVLATYSWSPSAGLSSSTISDPIANPTITTTYTVTKTAIAGHCFASATVTVTVNIPLPAVSAGTYAPVCLGGAPVSLTGSPLGGTFSGTGVSGSTFYPAVAGTGTYTITYSYTAANGCSNTASTTIEVNVCSFIITATAGPNGSISPAGNVSVIQGASQTFFFTPATCYITSSILVDGAPVTTAPSFTFNNVQATHTIDVTFAPDPSMQSVAATTITSSAPFNDICTGASATLTEIGGAVVAGAQWAWYEGSCTGTFLGNGTSISVSPTSTKTYFVKAQGGTCNASTTCASITINISTGSPTGHLDIISSPTYGYVGGTGTIVASTIPGATFYHWTSNGHDVLFDNQPEPYESSGPSVTVSFLVARSNYVTHVYAGNACGRTNIATVGIKGTVSPPAGITGSLFACANTSGTYSSATISDTKGYYWTITTVPANKATITGDGNQNITVNFLSGFQSATLCAHGRTNNNIDGPSTCIQITSAPAPPSSLNGPLTICAGSTQSYTAAGAASYSWATQAGTIVGSSTGSTVNIQFPASAFTNQQVCVYATACGNVSTPLCVSVSSTAVAAVGPVNGPALGVCGLSNRGYSVTINPDIISYAWSVPPGATISSGQGTNAIGVTFSSNFSPGNIVFTATFQCGTSTASLLVKGVPPVPVVTPGPGPYCEDGGDTYRASSSNVTSFLWTFAYPLDPDFIFTADSSQVFIIWGPNDYNAGGPGTVQARNGCGLSDPLNLEVITCNPIAGDEESKRGREKAFKKPLPLRD